MNSLKSLLKYGISIGMIGLLFCFLEPLPYSSNAFSEARVLLLGLLAMVIGVWAGRQWFAAETSKSKRQVPGLILVSATAINTELSQREYEVLQLMAQGYSNIEIADRLFISIHTVKSHSSKLFGKLEVQRRTQAIQKARQLNIIE